MKTSKDPRHQSRRLAISEVYSELSYDGQDPVEIKDTIKESLEIDIYDKDLYKEIILGVKQNKPQLEEMIQRNSKDWDLKNIYKIDLSILLAAVWELVYTKTPQKVVVDEAVELAKEFGEVESPKFINGVLSGVIIELGNPE